MKKPTAKESGNSKKGATSALSGTSKKGVISNLFGTSKKSEISEQGGAPRLHVISSDVARKFRVWFERNLAGFRSGVVGDIEYRRAGELDDRPGDEYWYANAYDRAVLDYTEPATPAEDEYILSHPLIALQLLLGLTDLRGVRCMRRGLTRRINSLQQKSYRSRYYDKDNRRRRILAAERRKIKKRTTLNPRPTPDEFRAAFAARNDSVESRIYFGGMVHDLECYVDNCLKINDAGEIVGRNGGIKYWLSIHVPELYCRYKTIMRYKALVKRLRQAVRVSDPVPTSDLLDEEVAQASQQAAARRAAVETQVTAERVDETQVGVKQATGKTQVAAELVDEKQAGVKLAAGETQVAAKSVGVKPRGSERQVVVWNGVVRIMELAEWRKNYYALESHYRQRKVAMGRVKGIFEGCANSMAGAFRVVDDYMDAHFDEFGCFREGNAKNSETKVSVSSGGGRMSAEAGGGRMSAEVSGKKTANPTGGKKPWGSKGDAYVRADGKRLTTRIVGKRRQG